MSLDECLSHIADLPFESARMLPFEAYRSGDLLARETRELFGRDWMCIGRAADVPDTGDFVTAELPVEGGRRSVIMQRGDAGVIRAFDNVCIHRGARLLDDCGHAARITCPYHGWVYRLDGSLIGGPHLARSVEADGTPFRASAHRLREVPTETWEGFVFVNQDDDATPLAPRLAGLTEVIGRYDASTYVPVHAEVEVWATNWKLLVENFMDAYHVSRVHAASFGATGDSTDATEVVPGTAQWAHHRVVEPGGPELAPRANTSLTGDWRRTVVLAAVFPGFLLQLQPNWLWCLRVTPVGTQRVQIAWHVAVAPGVLAEAPAADEYVSDLLALIRLVNSEDRPIVEGVRRSVDGRQIEAAPWSFLERNVYDFDRYVATRLTRHRPPAAVTESISPIS